MLVSFVFLTQIHLLIRKGIMVEKIQDLNLPTAVVTRLIKDALPDGTNISKEARIGKSVVTRIHSTN